MVYYELSREELEMLTKAAAAVRYNRSVGNKKQLVIVIEWET